jgi:EPS-associated MarR family transcriptional regulator
VIEPIPIKEKSESRRSRIQEDTDFRLLRLLEDHPDLSQREIAQKLGLSLGGLNYCLKALMEKGFIKLENFQNSRHKFRYVYVLTPAGIAQRISMTGRFLKRKLAEYEALRAEIEALKKEQGMDASDEYSDSRI